jgi:exosortase A-associated hydrolase 1
MSRLPLTFACGSLTLAGTLDTASGPVGLLIVSGGNEIRAGAFNGQADLAARIARAGFPVMRFDRRGIGDSPGENRGFKSSVKDIASALDAFRAMMPQLCRVVAFGNCDAASALMLAGGAGCDALVLSNPWTLEASDAVPPPEAIRARYRDKITNPREIMRLLGGGVNLRKLARGIGQALRPPPPPSTLAQEMAAGLAQFRGEVRILLATGDRTAQLFESAWDRADPRIARCKGAGHAYVEPTQRAWLEAQLLDVLRG